MRRMVAVFAAALLVIGSSSAANAAPVTAKWQYQLNWPIDTTVNAPLFDIDWNAAESGATVAQLASVVDTLHAKGATVVCYVDTGGWEEYRADAGAYPAEVLGNPVGGWPQERYVDVRRWDVLGPILTARFQQCADAGFDAVETDLDDQYLADTGFALTEDDYIEFAVNMAIMINVLGMDWYLKNGITGDDFIERLEPYAAATINESCWTFAECGHLAPFRDAGKPIYNVVYTGGRSATCTKAGAFPMNTIKKTYDLNAGYVWSC